jgi:AcrR family transcriptional regulator
VIQPIGSPGALARRQATLQQRERILGVAARVLADRGFERARLRDVAEAAGVSIGLLQNYFESRDAMLEEAFTWRCEQLIARWRSHSDLQADPWQRIVGLIDELMNQPDPIAHSVTWVEFCSSASRHRKLRASVARVYDTWRKILVEAVEEGTASAQFDPCLPADDIADAINAEVDGLHMAHAVQANLMTKGQFRHLALTVASRLIGCPYPAAAR